MVYSLNKVFYGTYFPNYKVKITLELMLNLLKIQIQVEIFFIYFSYYKWKKNFLIVFLVFAK